jgi:hypothetical protein
LLQTGTQTSTDIDLFQRVEQAGLWFLDSGIQLPHGGVARFYRTTEREYARASTEITGYALSAAVYLFHRTGDARYKEAARRAASFLSRKAWRPEVSAFPFEYGTDRAPAEALTYFFDTGIIIRGLLAWYRVSGEREYLDLSIAAAISLSRDFQSGEDRHPFEITGAARWQDLYERSLQRALATSAEFLPAETDAKTMDRLHAFCYFLEGLLPAADHAEIRHALDGGIRDVETYLKRIEPEFARSDVYAQLLRVRLYAEELAGIPMNSRAAVEEAGRLLQYQHASEDIRISGGYWFGRKAGELLPFVNPVSTAFCLQALDLFLQHAQGIKPDRRLLI